MSPRGRSPGISGAAPTRSEAPDKLAEYHRKRDFSKTSEPRGDDPRGSGFGYLIQKHAATRLHYDFRLELDGVLKSWAVTRGPSLDPADKRLAVHVEDHPIEYGEFEGLIPKKEYGGGTVLLWDRGEWEPLEDPQKMYGKGHLTFNLHGEKLKGKWQLVRMKKRSEKEKGDNWLLIKSDDFAASVMEAQEFLDTNDRSVKSGLSMEEIAQGMTGAVWHSKPRNAPKARPAWETQGPSNGKKGSGARTAAASESAGTKPRRKLSLKKVKGKRAELPAFVEPQKATRVDRPPEGDAWVHEIKLDGYRAEARLDGKKVQVLTRSGLDWSHRFGSVARAVQTLPAKEALLDGEIVAMSDQGIPDFPSLQAALSEERDDKLVYFVFDLLHIDGMDLRGLPLVERKALLEQLVAGAGPHLRYSEHFTGSGAAVLQQARQMRLEGVVSKRAADPYRSGSRSAWLKTKCRERQEFVIGGFSEPSHAGPGIGSLLLGQWEGRTFVYAGRVGSGFSSRVSDDVRRKLDPLVRDSSPFEQGTVDRRGKVHFVEPKLVCEVELAGWTSDNLVRQASFLGLREDKPARSVVREKRVPTGEVEELEEVEDAEQEDADELDEASSVSTTATAKSRRATTSSTAELMDMVQASVAPKAGAKPARRGWSYDVGAGRSKASSSAISRLSSTRSSDVGASAISRPSSTSSVPAGPPLKHGEELIEGIRITHPSRVLYPENGVTKRELAHYYIDIADYILPHVRGRPLSVVRAPDGVNKPTFYQKHLTAGMPDAIQTIRVKEEDGSRGEHVAIEDVSGLVALVQFGVVEIHPWGAPTTDIERADRIIFDLDPDPSVEWKDVVSAAIDVRDRLAKIKLRTLVKTTGGKGLHVVVPLNPPVPWEVAKAFSAAFAMHMSVEFPRRYIAKASKAARKGLIFIDYLRNGRGATAIAPYSSRAKPGANVSVPIEWDEVSPKLRSDQFTVRNLQARMKRLKRDPWAEFFRIRQTIDQSLFE